MKDVVVVGGGPAGSCAANYAGKEKDVLLLERREKPHSACAGGLTSVMVERIKPDLPQKAIQDKIKKAKLHLRDNTFEVKAKDAGLDYFLSVLDREKFDQTLLKNAEKNSEVLLETPATGLEKKDEYWEVKTPFENFETETVILTDGGPSKLAREAGLDTRLDAYDISSCVIDIVEESFDFIELFIKEKFVDIGYAGILPAGEVAKVGVCEEYLQGNNLEERVGKFKKEQGIDGKVRERVHGMIPSKTPLKSLIPQKNLALAGDAARLCRPFVGAGIDTAIASGRALGKTIASDQPLEKYEEKISKIKEEVEWFYSLKDRIYEKKTKIEDLFPLLSKTFTKHYDDVIS